MVNNALRIDPKHSHTVVVKMLRRFYLSVLCVGATTVCSSIYSLFFYRPWFKHDVDRSRILAHCLIRNSDRPVYFLQYVYFLQ